MSDERSTASGGGTERVSVVLATFNGGPFLPEQLTTIGAQTRLPDELIVVDDGSSDDTVTILREFASSAPFPVEVVVPDEHAGTCEAFGEAMRRATGTILAICDQDDRWHPAKLAVMEDRMSRRPEALLAFSDAVLVDVRGDRLSRSRWRLAGFGPRQWADMERDPFSQMMKRQIVSGCTAAIRSEILPALLPFPSGLHPALPTMMYDRWISLLAAAAGPIVTIPERLVDYRIHPNQQIGIPALHLRRMLPQTALRLGQFVAPRVEKSGRFAYQQAHLREIQKRLVANGLDSESSDARLRLADDHLRLRETLDESSALRRAVPVMKDYIGRKGYRRFSMGLASALSDVAR
jgi:glycosyltransferase involved in cell wall biosynthesis